MTALQVLPPLRDATGSRESENLVERCFGFGEVAQRRLSVHLHAQAGQVERRGGGVVRRHSSRQGEAERQG